MKRRSFLLPPLLFSLSLCLLPSGCGGEKNANSSADNPKYRPEWVDGSSMMWNPEDYITGVSSGDTLKDAQDKARSEVAKVFEVRIMAFNQSWQEESTFTDYEKLSGNKYRQTASEGVSTSTDKTLSDVTIAETWYDKENVRYYAIAALDRNKVGNHLSHRISELDASIKTLSGQLDPGADRLDNLRTALQALGQLKERERLNTELEVVSYEGTGGQAPYDMAALKQSVNDAIAAVKVGIFLTGIEASLVENAIIEAFAKSHFRIAFDQEEDLDLLVKGNIREAEETQLRAENMVIVKLSGTLQVARLRTNEIIGTITATGKDTSQSLSRATNRAQEALCKDIADKVEEKILEYLAR